MDHPTTLYGLDNNDEIPYDNNGVIRLVIIDPDGDGDWEDNEFTMQLMTTSGRNYRCFSAYSLAGRLQGHGDGYRCHTGRGLQ